MNEQCPNCKKYVVAPDDIADNWLECPKCEYSGRIVSLLIPFAEPLPDELEAGEREWIEKPCEPQP
jgi:hypothetical protein